MLCIGLLCGPYWCPVIVYPPAAIVGVLMELILLIQFEFNQFYHKGIKSINEPGPYSSRGYNS